MRDQTVGVRAASSVESWALSFELSVGLGVESSLLLESWTWAGLGVVIVALTNRAYRQSAQHSTAEHVGTSGRAGEPEEVVRLRESASSLLLRLLLRAKIASASISSLRVCVPACVRVHV